MIIKQNNAAFLSSIGHKYIDFLLHYGAYNEHECEHLITALFAQHCTKIVNGQPKSKHIQEYKQHLYKTKNMYGPWTVQLQKQSVVGDPDKNACAFEYDIIFAALGAFSAQTILVCDDLGFIIEIHEIYKLKNI